MTSLKAVLAFAVALTLSGCNLTLNFSGQGEVTFEGAVPKACASAFANCFSFRPTDEVTLSPVPANGFYFSHWEGDCAGKDSCTLKLSSTKQVRAIFLSANIFQPEFKPNTDHFFSAPWPNDAYNLSDQGYIDVEDFPFERGTQWDSQIKSLAKKTRGFSTNGGSFFQFSIELPALSDDDFDLPELDARPFAIVNVDPDSPNFGALVPSLLSSYERSDIGHESNHMLIVTPKPGYPLEPNTTYAAVLLKSLTPASQAAPLIEGLDAPYSTQWSISETLFNTLRFQKHQIATALQLSSNWQPSDFLAFTYFTTQDPVHITRALGSTLRDINNSDIISSVTAVTKLQECACDGPTCVEAFQLTTEAPTFLKGNAPYLFSGGEIEIADNKAKILGSHTLELLAKVPCEEIPAGGFPLIAHAHSTTEGWLNYQYAEPTYHRRSIEIALDAPESNRRRSPASDTLKSFLNLIGVSTTYLLDMITDFNVLNLNGAMGTHHQYAADLFYAELVGEVLADILIVNEFINQDDSPRYQAHPEQHVISGRSLGGIAAIHVLAMDTNAKLATIEKPPRPSYIHIENIVEFISHNHPDLERQLIKISGIVPVYARYQPLSHLVQTVMEPLDTINYVKYLDIPNLFMVLSKENDNAHGGESAFSIATALEQTSNIQPIYRDGIHEGDYENTLAQYILRTPIYRGYSGYNNGQGNQFISVEEDWLSIVEPTAHLENCFPYDTFNKPIYETNTNMVEIIHEGDELLCN